MNETLDLGDLDRFTVGAVGPSEGGSFCSNAASGAVTPHRQGREAAGGGPRRVSLAPLATCPARAGSRTTWSSTTSTEPQWVVGTLGVSYDEDSDRIVLVAEELVEEGEDGDVARCAVTRAQAAAFAIRATGLVEAGRPPCPMCGLPLDPAGHECPTDKRPPAPDHLTLLACGEVEILGRMPWSSNRTYLANCTIDGCGARRGLQARTRGTALLGLRGQPLPSRGRGVRAVAASGGWNLVPETVARS